jgi:hypothetical protein
MPFPETTTELVASGYKFDNDANCRGCGERIEWWVTPNGKKLPMDVDADGNAEAHWSNCPNAKDFRK